MNYYYNMINTLIKNNTFRERGVIVKALKNNFYNVRIGNFIAYRIPAELRPGDKKSVNMYKEGDSVSISRTMGNLRRRFITGLDNTGTTTVELMEI